MKTIDSPLPIISDRSPTEDDIYLPFEGTYDIPIQVGQLWVNEKINQYSIFIGIIKGKAQWIHQEN